MTQQERDIFAQAVGKMVLFYDRTDFDRAKVSMLIDVFCDSFPEASLETFLQALTAYRNDPKNVTFPSPARLQSYLRPVQSIDAKAHDLASKIVESISRFGYSDFKGMENYVGPVGVDVVRRMGGWSYVCENHGTNLQPGQFFAQTREVIKAILETKNTEQNLLALESTKTKQLENTSATNVHEIVSRLAINKTMI
jgi:hypothetical protein